ncbi:lactate utilization protein B/C [Mucilaginibacter hurinus]|uniref:Lactate utilization protein B/C n=1 Tax=Mucilaginibacter hurinus TaxID=2201324 RepID=A0A367GLL4_9SPHI|nr:LUD domain-containing protein [Mucilaginibacter hurinus]RCH53878.1 lactate utilization protein B/C [Mucilaginibacter hurinus]
MSSRSNILAAVLANQPDNSPLPDVSIFNDLYTSEDAVERFIATAMGIGSSVHRVAGIDEINKVISERFTHGPVVSNLSGINNALAVDDDNYHAADVELSVFKVRLAVAENGALWLTEEDIQKRVLPFICQHLALVVNAANIVGSMHQAYERIGNARYNYGTFISGPSKTADIEQSLVLGAHGPRSLTVFIID